MDYTKKQIEDLLQGVYSGEINAHDLPVDLYEATAKYLIGGLYQIEGKISPTMVEELKQNLYFFSGAKTYQQIAEMTILKNGDEIKTYSQFKKEALGIYEQYNQNWLKTEYNTTIGQAQMVERWEQIEAQKKTLPLLKYSAVIDPNTSEICRPLDGIVLPVDDKFWSKNSPLNHFNCRCLIIQLEDGDERVTEAHKAEEASKEVSKSRNAMFEAKPIDTRAIFTKDHPYFDVPPQDKAFAKRNFDLPIPPEAHPFEPQYLKDLGVPLDKSVFDLLETPVSFRDGKTSYLTVHKNEITLGTKSERWNNSDVHRESVIYHELGHAIHEQRGIIEFGKSVSPGYKTYFNSVKKDIAYPGGIERDIWNIRYKAMSSDPEVVAEVVAKYGVKSAEDVKELTGATLDSLMALTSGKYGGGHTKAYMKTVGAKEAELFAHSMENTFKGNPVFKEVMPEIYEKSIKYINSLK